MTTGVTISAFTSSKRQNSQGRYQNLYQITVDGSTAAYTSGTGTTVTAADFGTTGMTTITAIVPVGSAKSASAKYYPVTWDRSTVRIGFTKAELVGGLGVDIGSLPAETITFIGLVIGT